MSVDYPNRNEWLAKRRNPVAGSVVYGRMLRVVPATGKNRDPGLFHEHRRLKGPMTPAAGPGSINELDEMAHLVREQRFNEAKEYYQRCLNINYRKGSPKLHPRMVGWYQQIVAGRLS